MSGLLKITEGAVCMHPRVKLVWVPTGESQKQLRYQCFDCGCLNGKAIAHSKAKPNTELVDFEALDRYHREYQERYDQFRQDRKTRYAEYLDSDQWRALRERVFRRAGGTCEGCGLHPATQVHHLTYAHIFSEFLFELVAVCDDCHRLTHASSLNALPWWDAAE